MAGMNSVDITDREGRITVWACNAAHEGVFHRRPCDCAYQQTEGTCQTPVFKTKAQFRRYLRRHYGVRGSCGLLPGRDRLH